MFELLRQEHAQQLPDLPRPSKGLVITGERMATFGASASIAAATSHASTAVLKA